MKKWQEDFEKLIISITDTNDPDFRICVLEEGFESEERAKEITRFIKENNIDCRGCFDGDDEQRHNDYLMLAEKITEHWETVNEWGDD